MPPPKCAPLNPAVHDWGSSRSPELQGFRIRLEALHPLLRSSAHFHRTFVLTPLDKTALSGPRSRVPAKGSHLMLYYTIIDGTFRSLRFQLCTTREGDSKQRPHSYVAGNVSPETRGIGSRQSVCPHVVMGTVWVLCERGLACVKNAVFLPICNP